MSTFSMGGVTYQQTTNPDGSYTISPVKTPVTPPPSSQADHVVVLAPNPYSPPPPPPPVVPDPQAVAQLAASLLATVPPPPTDNPDPTLLSLAQAASAFATPVGSSTVTSASQFQDILLGVPNG